MTIELWNSISIFKYYEASSLWRIRSIDRIIKSSKQYQPTRFLKWKVLKLNLKKDWYLSVKINHKHYNVHRLIALSFLWEPMWRQVNHKNKIRNDNRLENLEYVTSSENQKHSYINGRTWSMLWRTWWLHNKSKKILVEYSNWLKQSFNSVEECKKFIGISNINCYKRKKNISHISYII